MVRSIRRGLSGLAGLAILTGLVAPARSDDAPPKPAAGAPDAAATSRERARSYTLPGGEPLEPFVPLKPRTVEDRERVEALSEYCVARAMEDRRNWTGAVQLYEKALAREPESLTILRRLSRLSFILGRTEQGIQYSRRVLNAAPGDTETLVRLVNYYNNRRNDAAAAEGILKDTLANPKLEARSGGRLVALSELGKLYAGKLQNVEKAADIYAKLIDALDEKEATKLSPADLARVLGGDEAAAYEEYGLVFVQAKRHELAARAFERGLDYDPDDPEIPLHLARTYQKMGQNERALRTVEAFLRRQPSGVEGYELLAQVLAALKREAEITPRLEAAAKADSKNVALQYILADRYRETGQVEKADALYKSLLAAQPTTQGYGALAASLLKRKKADDLIKVVSDAVVRPGGLEAVQETIKGVIADPAFAEQVLDAGQKLLAAEPPGLARPGISVLAYIATRTSKLEKLLPIQRLELKRNPNPQAFKELAALLASLHKYAEVASTLEEMLTRFPAERNARNLTDLVQYYRMSDQPAAAEKIAREALKLDPNDLDVQVQLALVLSQTGKTDEAVALLEASAKKAPNNPAVGLIFGSLLSQVGQNEKALTVFKDLLQKYPANDEVITRARSQLSIIYVNMGDYAKGEAELEILLQRNPDEAGVNNDLGYLYADQGKNLEKAESMIRKAVAEEPDNSSYLDSLGWVLFKRGKVKEALEPLEKAARKAGEAATVDATIYEHLGDVYFQLRDNARAKESWQAAEKAAAKSQPPDKRLPEIRKKLESLDKLGKEPKPAASDNP